MLDRESGVPLTTQLKDALRLRIDSGEWRAGQRITSEPDLARQLGIARGTARSALSQLVYEGLLERRQGDGTYVAQRSLEQNLMGFYSFAREAQKRGLEIASEVLEWSVLPAGETMAARLALSPGDEVLRVQRVRSLAEEPILLETCHLPAAMARRLQRDDFTRGALYDALERFCEARVVHAEETFEATTLGRYEAGLLGVAPGSPAFRVERTATMVGQRPVEFRVSLIRGDRCRYSVSLG